MPPKLGKHHEWRTTSAVRRGSQKEMLIPTDRLTPLPQEQTGAASVLASGSFPFPEIEALPAMVMGSMQDQQTSVMGFAILPLQTSASLVEERARSPVKQAAAAGRERVRKKGEKPKLMPPPPSQPASRPCGLLLPSFSASVHFFSGHVLRALVPPSLPRGR